MTKKDSSIKGIFSPVEKMIEWACGDCTNGHGLTSLDLSTNGKGKQAPKTSVVEFMGDIDDIPQLSFPVPGNKHLVHYMAHYAYVHFVDTPGLIFVTILDPPGISSQFVFSAVFACYPVFLISMCMMFVAGFVVWVLVSATYSVNVCFYIIIIIIIIIIITIVIMIIIIMMMTLIMTLTIKIIQ